VELVPPPEWINVISDLGVTGLLLLAVWFGITGKVLPASVVEKQLASMERLAQHVIQETLSERIKQAVKEGYIEGYYEVRENLTGGKDPITRPRPPIGG
jgi:hypothetical protein